jgi:aspartate aminotransferase
MVCLQAEQKMLAAGYNKEYLPIEGLDAFRQATVQLLLGSNSAAVKEGRVAVIQVRCLVICSARVVRHVTRLG